MKKDLAVIAQRIEQELPDLDPIKLKGLAEGSQELLARLDRELTAFSQFLLRF